MFLYLWQTKDIMAKTVEEIMKERLSEYGFSESDLTAEEMAEFREECEDIANGYIVLDGVLEFKSMNFLKDRIDTNE